MRKLKDISVTLLLILILCFVTGGLGYVWFRFSIVEPYQEFRAKEREAIPLFDALNENVEHSLPSLPPDSVLVEKSSTGITIPTTAHERWLNIDIKTQIQSEYISDIIHIY
jgi:hypothetical protein